MKHLVGTISVVVVLLISSVASAHVSKSGIPYPTGCCSGQDCDMLRNDRVHEGPNGYEVLILPGEHPFVVNEPFRITIPYNDPHLRDTMPDGAYHICLSPTLELRCFFHGKQSG